MKTYFKFSERMKKIFNYFSIFTIVIGSTFGTINTANAAAITLTENSTNATNGVNPNGTPATLSVAGADTVNLADFTLAVTGLDGTATAFSILAVTGTSADTAAELELNFQEDNASIAQVITVESLVITADSDTAGVLDINFADAAGTSGTATFTGEVDTGIFGTTLGTIDIDMADSSATTPVATINFGGDVRGTTTIDEGAEDITVVLNGSSAQTYTGTINSNGGDGEANLRVTNTAGVTFANAVGKAGSGALATIDLNGATTFSGASEANVYTVDADTTFTGAVLANTSFTQATAGTDVTLSAASNLGAATVTIGSLTSDALLTTTDLVNTAGKVYLNVKDNEMGTGKLTMGSGAELHVGKALVSEDNIYSSDDSAGEGDFNAAAKIYMPSNLTSAETLTITDAGAFDQGDASKTAVTTAARIDAILQDTALVNYSASAASAGATVITITATDRTKAAIATQLGTTANNATAALQLMAAMDSNDTTGDTGAFTAFDNALKAQGGLSATEDTSFINQTSPQTDLISGSTFATQAMTGSLQGIMSNRMAALRSGDAYATGMSAGSLSANSGFLQVFATDAEQKSKTVGSGTQAGYDTSSAGLAIGFDGIADNGSVVGLSISMTQTDVDGKGSGQSVNDIDSYTASIYVDNTTDAGYVEGSLTVGLNQNNSSRKVNTGGLDRTLKGDYDSEQVSLKIGGGMPNAVGTGFVTPFGSVTATRITTDAYTETSSTSGDALRLRVAQADVDSTVGTVGLKYHTELDNGGVPMISLAVNNEFGDNKINSTNTYQGGGSAFQTSTDVEELSATLGLGYSFSSDMSSVEFAYEVDANDDDYLSHYGSFKIVGKF